MLFFKNSVPSMLSAPIQCDLCNGENDFELVIAHNGRIKTVDSGDGA